MPVTFYVSIYPRARSHDKARKAIVRFQEKLPTKLTVNSMARNEQDTSTFRVDCTATLQSMTPPDALYETLMMLQAISLCWLICGPEERSDGHWQFHGFAQEHQIEIQGIKYVAFGISPGEIPEVMTFQVQE